MTQPAPIQLERAKANTIAVSEFQKEIAKSNLSFAAEHSHSQKGKEASEYLQKLPVGSLVLVGEIPHRRGKALFL